MCPKYKHWHSFNSKVLAWFCYAEMWASLHPLALRTDLMVTECPNCEASLMPIPLAFSTENLNPPSSFLNNPTVSADVTVQPTLHSSFSKEGGGRDHKQPLQTAELPSDNVFQAAKRFYHTTTLVPLLTVHM